MGDAPPHLTPATHPAPGGSRTAPTRLGDAAWVRCVRATPQRPPSSPWARCPGVWRERAPLEASPRRLGPKRVRAMRPPSPSAGCRGGSRTARGEGVAGVRGRGASHTRNDRSSGGRQAAVPHRVRPATTVPLLAVPTIPNADNRARTVTGPHPAQAALRVGDAPPHLTPATHPTPGGSRTAPTRLGDAAWVRCVRRDAPTTASSPWARCPGVWRERAPLEASPRDWAKAHRRCAHPPPLPVVGAVREPPGGGGCRGEGTRGVAHTQRPFVRRATGCCSPIAYVRRRRFPSSPSLPSRTPTTGPEP